MERLIITVTDTKTGEQQTIKTSNTIIAFENLKATDDENLGVGTFIKSNEEFIYEIGSNKVVEHACMKALTQIIGETDPVIGDLLSNILKKL